MPRVETITYIAVAIACTVSAALIIEERWTQPSPPEQLTANQLDLAGSGTKARKIWHRLIAAATTTPAKVRAMRSMAVSWGFEANCGMAGDWEHRALDVLEAEGGKDANGFLEMEIADEAARICLYAGDLDSSDRWSHLGYDFALRNASLTVSGRAYYTFSADQCPGQ